MPQKRKLPLLILSFLCLLFLGFILFAFPPAINVQLLFLHIPIVWIFLLLLGIFIYSTISFFFKSFIHGVLAGMFVVIALIFRLTNLSHPIFFILLAGLFLSLELMFTYKK